MEDKHFIKVSFKNLEDGIEVEVEQACSIFELIVAVDEIKQLLAKNIKETENND